jgi:hypothetical protein
MTIRKQIRKQCANTSHRQSMGSLCKVLNLLVSRRSDLNRGPADYESAALPTELRRLEGV